MKKILCALLGMMFAIPSWAENESYTNLLDNNTFLYGYHYGPSTGNLEKYSGRTATQPISVKDIDSISIRFSTNKNQVQTAFIAYDENGALQQRNTTSLGMGITEGTYDVSQYDKVAFFWWNTDASVGQPGAITNVMVVKGSTPQDYTPYLYPIKIATTAYNSARFSPVVTELNDTIATIRDVVTNTINQTKAIADLQATKQTRPDENCPAGKKCLLVEDDAGQPHWYEIIENAYGLPSGYTGLEYVDMQSESYLQTDIVPTYDGRIEMDFQTTTIPAVGGAFMGGRSAGYPAGLILGFNVNKTFVFDGFSENRYQSTNLLTNNTRYKYTWNNQVAKLETGGSVVGTNTFTGTGTTTHPLFINGANNAGSVIGNKAGIYLYSFKVWNALGELVMDLIPAKNSSGVIGMYDTVSGTFFTNKGSGTFTAGPEVQ